MEIYKGNEYTVKLKRVYAIIGNNSKPPDPLPKDGSIQEKWIDTEYAYWVTYEDEERKDCVMFGADEPVYPDVIDGHILTNADSMFLERYNLVTAPYFDSSNITNTDWMFAYCSSLTTINELDMNKVQSSDWMFIGCTNLITCNLKNLQTSIDLSESKNLSIDSMLYLFQNAKQVTGKILTLGITNLNKLTPLDKMIITNKGWTLR